MNLLIAGIVAWSVVHLFPALAPSKRDRLVSRLGNNAYRGLFALLIIGSLVVIVIGWKSATPSAVYVPPLVGSPVVAALVLIAFVLFVAAQSRTNIKRLLRHPQLTGIVAWSVAHLLANGDSRSVALFGGLGVWAVLEIALINRRDGARDKPASVSPVLDVRVVIIAAVAYAVFVYFHELLFGVSAMVL